MFSTSLIKPCSVAESMWFMSVVTLSLQRSGRSKSSHDSYGYVLCFDLPDLFPSTHQPPLTVSISSFSPNVIMLQKMQERLKLLIFNNNQMSTGVVGGVCGENII